MRSLSALTGARRVDDVDALDLHKWGQSENNAKSYVATLVPVGIDHLIEAVRFRVLLGNGSVVDQVA